MTRRNRIWLAGYAAVATALWVGVGVGIYGCASSGTATPEQQRAARIVGLGILIGLDIDALQDDGATEAERQALRNDVNEAILLLGTNEALAGTLTEMILLYEQTGKFDENGWRLVARGLVEWAAPPPAPASPP